MTTASDGEISLVGTAKYYDQQNFPFNYAKITGQGTPTIANVGVFYGWSLPIYDSDDEELNSCICMPENWDGTTDPIIYLGGWIPTAEAAKIF